MAVLTAERPSTASTDRSGPVPLEAPAPAPARVSVGSRGRRAVRLLVVVALAAAVAHVGRYALMETRPRFATASERAAAAAAAPAPTTSASPIELDAALPSLRAFVEQKRHLQFTSIPKTTLLDDAAFVRRLDAGAMTADERAATTRTEEVLKTLGLLTPDADLAADEVRSSEEGVLGFYDPSTKELVVRSSDVTPYAREVLVHELTHALDDQHFGLARPDMTETVEDHLAFEALTEGDAVRVERAYVASLTDSERKQIAASEDAIGQRQTVKQQAAYYLNAFPYLDGARFVTSLAKQGGEAAVDAAFADPPRSTAEILIPQRYLHHIHGIRLSAPYISAPAFDSGVVGALGLFLMLQSAVPIEDAARAAATWEGDLYLAWHNHDRTCVTARFVLDTPWDAAFTARVLDAWSRQQIDAHVDAPGTVLVQACR